MIAGPHPVEPLASPAKLSLREVSKVFHGRNGLVEAIRPASTDIQEGEFLVFVGPSGCGKSTLLNLIAGFDSPTSGHIHLDGVSISGPGSDRMMMFQEPALFPWLKVLDNVLFGLKSKKKLTSVEKLEVARYYLHLVRLGQFENAMPHELSGGMKQRVALARALAPNPRVLLMDEPFAALDALTRERLYVQIQSIFSTTKKTVVFVTHNVREAACLGDRVLIFSARPGRVKREMKITLPRPRSFYSPEVSRFASGILEELKSELGEDHADETLERHAFLPVPDRSLADGI